MKPYLSATEFARVVKKTPKTVIRWVEQGLIPGAKRVGHHYQIPCKEIDTYQNSTRYPAR